MSTGKEEKKGATKAISVRLLVMFVALLIALVLGLFSATVPTKTVQTNPIDTPTETKIVEWAIGYGKRCKGYCGKVQPRN